MAKETQQGGQKATGLTRSAASGLATGRKPARSGRRTAARTRVEAAGLREQAAPAAPRKSRARREAAPNGSVTMQARVDAEFARELVETDARVLGLEGTSALVREGLRLVHKRARELAMAEEYQKFYGDEPAPVPEGVAAIWGD